MYTATKYLFLAFLFCGMGFASQMEFKDAQQAQKEQPIDINNDGYHDLNCECGYCLEGNNDSINEWHNQFLPEFQTLK